MRRREGDWEKAITGSVESVRREILEIRRFQQACEDDKAVAAWVQMNEKEMAHSTSYANLILVAGYAGYFAFWSTLLARLPHWLYAVSGLLALSSLLLFISWEVTKMIWGTVYLNRIQTMLEKSSGRGSLVPAMETARRLHEARMNRLWIWLLVPTVAFGIGAGLLLVGYFGLEVWKTLF
ncbi:hypothetical protein IFT80_19620 [Pseudomonas sp. CFBP 8771]|uniref:hypothetical protein n=1 Tax=Pseudomonas sp. CFBP 8771 TaxID=2775285 RepID=UPI001781FE99|nr:hypothetical protein [Pseudomonas sp. CFBP 8771]MBD8604853.1 hypothetical protein [Pseudomonas sp. CFBP 8771]